MSLQALKGYTWPAYFVNCTIYWFKLFIIWCSSHASQISLHPSSFPPSWSHQLRPLIGQNGGSGRVKNQAIWVELHKIDNQNQWMVQVTKYADWVYYLSAGASSTQFQLPAALNIDNKQLEMGICWQFCRQKSAKLINQLSRQALFSRTKNFGQKRHFLS